MPQEKANQTGLERQSFVMISFVLCVNSLKHIFNIIQIKATEPFFIKAELLKIKPNIEACKHMLKTIFRFMVIKAFMKLLNVLCPDVCR